MDSKTFDFFEKMFADFKNELKSVKDELKAEMQEVRTELKAEIQEVRTELKAEIQEVRTELKAEIQTVGNQVVKLENSLNPKVEALFDGYRQLAEDQEEIKNQLYDLASRMDNQELEITTLKRVK